MMETRRPKFSKSILEQESSPQRFSQEESPLRGRHFSNLTGTQKASEDDVEGSGVNTSPRVIIEEEVTDDSEFLAAIDKLVSETETLLNSYEKL